MALAAAVTVMASMPRVYLGTMTFAWDQASSPVTEEVAVAMTRAATKSGISTLDSARIYSGGKCEPMVGECLRTLASDGYRYNSNSQASSGAAGSSSGDAPFVRITTKAHPSQPGGLSPSGLEAQLEASLKDLGVCKVDEFYLHQPDTAASLEATLEACHHLVTKGLIGALGMSNYHAIEVERACEMCAAKGWTPPTVYQGLYNPLNRLAEKELLPTLKRNGIRFVAYNALAAGLLTGKHQPPKKDQPLDGRAAEAASGSAREVAAGRFKNNPNYLPRFYTDANFNAVAMIEAALPAGVSLVEASYLWLLHHSELASTDGLLLGASSLEQLDSNLDALQKVHADGASSLLPPATLAAFDAAWEAISSASNNNGQEDGSGASTPVFPYWRGYSSDQPGRESLHPGAAYAAHGPK